MVEEEGAEKLRTRVKELEAEVTARESDLARFRRELAAANEKLEGMIAELSQDLRLAHKIQKALLPTELPNIPGFEFSSKFVASLVQGGDYFDIFEHQDRARFGIVVASSQGTGMAVLLLSVLLKLTGQMEARGGAEPEIILGKIVSELKEAMVEGQVADLFYSRLDRRTYELTYCRAGDVIAVVQSYSDGVIRSLEATSKAVDIKSETKNMNSQVTILNPRDRLILCTPGVLAAKNLNGEAFGRERLFKTILKGPKQGVHELRNDILYGVQQFTGGAEPQRDQTVVVCEVKDRIIKLAQS